MVNRFIADIGLPGWLEAMKRKRMDALLKIASTSINSAQLQLAGPTSDEGARVKKGFFAGIKSKAIEQFGSVLRVASTGLIQRQRGS